jgi:hypothetical protein
MGGQCVISANLKQTATWRVDLEDIISIHSITIYYRTENSAWVSYLELHLMFPVAIYKDDTCTGAVCNCQIVV